MVAQGGPPNQNQISLVAGANVTLSVSSTMGTQTITIIGGGTGGVAGLGGFSAGTQTTSGGTIVFSNSNGISFGMSNSSVITASYTVPAANTGSFGISNLGNASGTSGVATGSGVLFVLAGGNNVTLSQSLNGASATVTISAFTQTVQTQNRFNATIAGNTSGALADISSGTLILAGGNNVTLSQAGNAITISGAAQGGVQTGISGIVASGSTNSSGTISFANSNGVTFGLSNNTITASVAAAGVASAVIGGNTTGTTASISSGQLTIAGGNNITISQAGGNAITISAPNTTAQSAQTQSNIQAIIPLGNTAGTTGTIQTGSFGLAGGANITISQSSGANSTALTIIGGAGVPSISAAGNTTGSTSAGGGSLILAGGNNVTLSGSTAAGAMTLTISVPNTASQSVQTQNLFNLSASTGPGGATTGTMALVSSGTLTLAAGSNITLSQAGGNAITIIAGQSTQTQGLGAIQIGTGQGSTTGTTAQITLGTMTLAAGANITLSQAAGNVITISGSDPATVSLGVSNIGNTSGTTGLISGDRVSMVFAGGQNITLSQSKTSPTAKAATISIIGAPLATFSFYRPFPGASTNVARGNSTLQINAFQMPGYLQLTQAGFPLNIALSTSSNSSWAGALSVDLGLYTRNVSTLSLATSGSVTYQFSNTSDNSTGQLSGLRFATLPISATLTPGDYWFGFVSRTTVTNANWITMQERCVEYGSIAGPFAATSSNTNVSLLGNGQYSATTLAMPASIHFTDIRGNGANMARAIQVVFANFSV